MKSSNFETPEVRYPQSEIEIIKNTLAPAGFKKIFRAGQHLHLMHRGERVCYIILSGHVSYRHKENGFVISYMYPDYLIGIGHFLIKHNAGYFHSETDTETIRITERKFNELFTANIDLWKSLSYYMTYLCHCLIIRDTKINSKNAYHTIKSLLIELMEQPKSVSQKITASRFILERTHLSRSTVMYILSELRRGQYITIKKGVLIQINKLPNGL